MTSEPATVHAGIDFGEGPRWRDGRLWFSDFFREGVFTLEPTVGGGRRETRVVTVEARPSGLGWLPDGTLLIVSMLDRRVLALPRGGGDGDLRLHADLSEIATGNCNDMVVAVDGTAYVGNFGFDLDGGAEFATASLARISPDGEVAEAATDLAFPNGAVITPDGATLIVGETFGGRYSAFDIGSGGILGRRRVWAAVPGSTPDGCCLDADGAIWMADIVNSRVARVLEGGEVTDVIDTPDQAVACALGGDDRRTLFIFVSPSSVPEEVAGKGLGRVLSARVAVPGAGLP